jgi:outer membrane protein TolC
MKSATLVKLLVAVLVLGSAMPAQAQPQRAFRIAVVVDGPWDGNEAMRELLQKSIGEVIGKTVPVSLPPEKFFVGDWTLAGAHAMDERVLADPEVDIVLGMGLIVSQDLATRADLPKPVIAPIVLDPVRQKVPLNSGTSGVKNLSYLVFPLTFERDIKLFRSIIPFKKIAYISSRRYYRALPPAPVPPQALGEGLGIAVTPILLDSSAAEALDAIPPDAEAVYLQPILHLPREEFVKLVNGFIKRRLPSFSLIGESEVRQGIMAGANPDFLPRLTRRIALHVRRIIAGEDPGTLSVVFPAGNRLFFNFRTAYQVGTTPSWDVLLESEIVAFDTTSPFAEHYTLGSALRRIIDANLTVQSSVRGVSAAAENVAEARSALLPTIDMTATGVQIDRDRAQAGYLPERTGAWEASATQVILSEPALANLSIQSSLLRSKESELDVTRLNEIVAGASAYLNLLRVRKIFFILLDNLRITRSNLELAETRRRTGAAGQDEPLRWQAEIAEVKKAVLSLQSQMQQVRYALNRLLNLPLTQELTTTDVSLDDSSLFIFHPKIRSYLENPLAFDVLTEYMVNQGLEISPELRQLDAGIAAQERALTSTQLSYFVPTIAAFAKLGTTFYKSSQNTPFSLTTIPTPPAGLDPLVPLYLGRVLSAVSPVLPDRQDWSVGLQVSLNLFKGFATRASEIRSGELLDQLRIQRKDVTEGLALRIRTDMQNAKTSYFAIQQSRAEQEAARQGLDIVTESYSRGAVPMLNLLDAQNAALRANQVAVNAQYDFLITYMQLQRSLGRFDVLMTADQRAKFLSEAIDYMDRAIQR